MTPRPTRLRPLSDLELESYDHLDPDLARKVRVAKIPLLPGRYVGVTLGPLVVLQTDEPVDGTSALLAHELVHVRQWQQQGPLRFVTGYLGAFASELWRCRRWNQAYRAIPAEVEARSEATRWAQRRHRRHDHEPD